MTFKIKFTLKSIQKTNRINKTQNILKNVFGYINAKMIVNTTLKILDKRSLNIL